MKISDLSSQSGVPLATIKFYQRERLLPPGLATGPNQASYGESHLRRLALIRVLRETGGLSLATIGRIAGALDAQDVPIEDLVGEVVDSLGEEGRVPAKQDAARHAAAADVDRFLASEGLIARAEGTARGVLVDSLVSIRKQIAPGAPALAFKPYLEAMRGLTAWEMQNMPALQRPGGETGPGGTSELLESIVYGTVLFERVILALRRLLHEAAFLEERGLFDEMTSEVNPPE